MAEGGARGADRLRRFLAVVVGVIVVGLWLPLALGAVPVVASDTFTRTLASGWGSRR